MLFNKKIVKLVEQEFLVETLKDKQLLRAYAVLNKRYTETVAAEPGLKNKRILFDFLRKGPEITNFVLAYGQDLANGQDNESNKIKEKIIDMLGLLRIVIANSEYKQLEQSIVLISGLIYPGNKKLEIDGLVRFMRTRKNFLEMALQNNKKIVFVIGHENPDTDAAVSSIMEAYRNSLLDSSAEYIPVLQSTSVPPEVVRLLGSKIAESIIVSNNKHYQAVLAGDIASWILVDHNVSGAIQKNVVSIVDHHALAPIAKALDIPITCELAGSTIALIAQKFLGMGFTLDQEVAKIFYGAALMDTENYHPKKTTSKDELFMADLQSKSQVTDSSFFFQQLMSALLDATEAKQLFYRDYKEDGRFGFAVCKIKSGFDIAGKELKPKLFSDIIKLAEFNNRTNNLPVTIVKVVDYQNDNQTINRERMYVILNENANPALKVALFEFFKKTMETNFSMNVRVNITDNALEYWGEGAQLSRKILTPILIDLIQ